ncbi:uncharacterized protein BO97DRAFT_139285 [Aspergillus homomorphus CBS 101889]|uniref:Uncharacterized protein n=1 Tax=Aspergillus homomorphus (strain CBS 101889) TaxID=1450537 RepID=A0A395I9F8_ASPHC|nr:hypothetical protein BO97DRAFT_139285 [Aspergillus homomorphus CBS 101889]RAL16595.1 hypothetical protein BO97DRAFT_139285 [Aspergillus homomorphus CBS 101889]
MDSPPRKAQKQISARKILQRLPSLLVSIPARGTSPRIPKPTVPPSTQPLARTSGTADAMLLPLSNDGKEC